MYKIHCISVFIVSIHLIDRYLRESYDQIITIFIIMNASIKYKFKIFKFRLAMFLTSN